MVNASITYLKARNPFQKKLAPAGARYAPQGVVSEAGEILSPHRIVLRERLRPPRGILFSPPPFTVPLMLIPSTEPGFMWAVSTDRVAYIDASGDSGAVWQTSI
jgi:hypothetical protein